MSQGLNFKIPVIKVCQMEKENQAIFIGKIKLKDIYEKNQQRFDIHIWRDEQPLNKKGYQREPSPIGISKITDYILLKETENPLFPTSVLVNCRENLEFSPIQQDSDLGFLHVTDTLWIIDGQHRIKAFEKIMSNAELRESNYGEYEIPIVVMTGFNTTQEIEQFFIINSRQKKVKTDLAQQIYLSLALENFGTKMIPEKERWQLNAVKIVQNLSNAPELSDGVWTGRIAMPNEDKEIARLRLISQNSFVSSLKPFFIGAKAKWPANVINEKRGFEIVEEGTQMLFKFWRMLRNIYVKPFQEPKEYSLFNTVGVYSMHLFLITVINENKGADFNKILDIAEEKLKFAFEECGFGDGFWRKGNRFAAQKGRNAAAYSSSAGQKSIADKIFFGRKIIE